MMPMTQMEVTTFLGWMRKKLKRYTDIQHCMPMISAGDGKADRRILEAINQGHKIGL